MKNIFILKGLDCAACASKIETKIKKQLGLKEVSLNFLTGKLTIQTSDTFEGNLFEQVSQIVKKEEPDVMVQKI